MRRQALVLIGFACLATAGLAGAALADGLPAPPAVTTPTVAVTTPTVGITTPVATTTVPAATVPVPTVTTPTVTTPAVPVVTTPNVPAVTTVAAPTVPAAVRTPPPPAPTRPATAASVPAPPAAAAPAPAPVAGPPRDAPAAAAQVPVASGAQPAAATAPSARRGRLAPDHAVGQRAAATRPTSIGAVARSHAGRPRAVRHEPLFPRPELAVAAPQPRRDVKTEAFLAAFAALAAAGLAGAARSSGAVAQVVESGRLAAGHAVGALFHRPAPHAPAQPAPQTVPPSAHEEPTIPSVGSRVAHVAGAAISRTGGVRAVQIALLALLVGANAALVAVRAHVGRMAGGR
jgi:hypothetical protein